MDVKEKIRKFFDRVFRNHEITDDDNIFEKSFVNSLFAMQLVLFIEKEFDIEITNQDLEPEKLNSINAICKLIESKLKIENT